MKRNEEIKNGNLASIILAGGKGTRMGVKDKHKCTFDVAGKPSIIHLIDNLRDTNFTSNVIVVGALSNQIMETVSNYFDDVAYVYQPYQRGTGNAAKYGVKMLEESGYEGLILIVTGDSIIEKEALEYLLNDFKDKEADLALLVKKKEDNPLAGHIVFDNDIVIGSIEFWDIMKAYSGKKVLDLLESDEITQLNIENIIKKLKIILETNLKSKKKINKVFPQISELLYNSEFLKKELQLINKDIFIDYIQNRFKKIPTSFIIKGKEFSAEDILNNTKFVNISVYLFNSSVLYQYIDYILSDNAQNEEYLTDIIQIFSESNKKIIATPVLHPNNVLSFNNPEELVEIRDYISKKYSLVEKKIESEGLRNIDKWLDLFETEDPFINEKMKQYYGESYHKFKDKMEQYITTIKGFKSKFPDEKSVFIVRTPGRLNLMGRHIDHRGGDVNMIAIDSEMISVISPRNDDCIIAYNKESEQFPAKRFCVSDILSKVDWEDWMGFISNKKIIEMVRNSQGDWINYLKAAALRQQSTVDIILDGCNCFFNGRIPQAAGLSSSSALVVNMLDSLININSLKIKPREFIDLCGEGEWFVGTRGGSADHAAIKVSNKDKITRLGFFEFEIKDFVEFPKNLDIVIINSMKKANKSNQELKKYNEKVLAYEIGFEIIRRNFPQFSEKLNHLRDINSINLDIEEFEIYDILKKVPNSIIFRDLNKYIGEKKLNDLKKKFTLFQPEDVLEIRPVIIYGVSECHRSSECLNLLKNNKIKEFGELMYISHNGDRVVEFFEFSNNQELSDPIDFLLDYSDDVLEELKSNKIPLKKVSGAYRCSIPEIDFIVDFMKTKKTVYGAQISGAGLGGCVMILIERINTELIINEFVDLYYNRWKIKPDCIVTKPIFGSSIF